MPENGLEKITEWPESCVEKIHKSVPENNLESIKGCLKMVWKEKTKVDLKGVRPMLLYIIRKLSL